jgi:tetratricopeptide (TPR) repeat protein
MAEGALARADRLLDTLDLTVGIKGLAMGFALGTWAESREKMIHRRTIGPQSCEQPVVDTQCQMFMGWGLARSGDLSGAAESLRILRRRAAEVEGDAAAARTRYADLVEGTLAAARGQDAEARRLLAPIAQGADNPGLLSRLPLAQVELRQGNVTEAVRYFEGNLGTYSRVEATFALAKIHEERGEKEDALRLYRGFLTITRAGDPDLPEIVEARAALARLGG